MCYLCETQSGGKFKNRFTLGRCLLCSFGLIFVILIGIAAGLLAYYLPDYVKELKVTRYKRVAERAGLDTSRYVNYTQCSNSDELKAGFKYSLLWQCDDNSCIPDYLRCSGYFDCLDFSDEGECDKYCRESVKEGLSFSCVEEREVALNSSYGVEFPECFLISMECDGSAECPQDGELDDEADCDADTRLADGDDLVLCGGGNTVVCYEEGTPYCVPDSYHCDGFEYCINGEDEVGCDD